MIVNLSTSCSTVSNYVGMFGVGAITIAYYLCQAEVWGYNDFRYLIGNLVGSFCLIFSLLFNWNLPSFIIEIIWIAITFYGIFKRVKNKSSAAH